MLQVNAKQALTVVLAALMIQPFPVQAASASTMIGSISSYGSVTVGDVSAPRESTLFSGDVVNTRSGNATVQYKQGARVLLANDSAALFSTSSVELRNGQMSFRPGSDMGVAFSASSLRLQPAKSSSANVTLKDGKATVSVTEGTVEVIDPSGAKLATVGAGEAKLFAMASPAPAAAAPAPAAAAPPAPASKKVGGVPVWVVVGAVAAVSTTVGVALKMNSNDGSAIVASPSR